VIFDLDGLLVDSEPVQKESFNVVLRQYGVELDDEAFTPFVGCPTAQNFAELKRLHGIEASVGELLRRKAVAYASLIDSELRVMPGATCLLGQLSALKVPTAVASSSVRRDVDRSLDATGLSGLLHVVVAGDEVTDSKPAPDIYLKAAGKLGMPPGLCVAIEDSETGVNAAYAAGIQCIVVPNRYTRHGSFLHACRIEKSLESIRPEMIEEVLEGEPQIVL